MSQKQIGENHPRWTGGSDSYLREKAKENLIRVGINIKGKVVHHKDKNVHNYNLNNLKIINSRSKHAKFHYENGDYPAFEKQQGIGRLR
jgi:5-methylcytosine-specific restriction endonuclease McrA